MWHHRHLNIIIMNLVKGIIKANLAKDPFDIIFWADPTSDTFKQALTAYQAASLANKTEIQQRAVRKLKKEKQPKTAIAILCLFNYLLAEGYEVNVGDMTPTVNTSECKNDKQKLSESNFFQTYFEYLKAQSQKPCSCYKFNETELEGQVKYCEAAIKGILKLIQNQFIIEHVLGHSDHKQLHSVAVNKMVTTTGYDLKILNEFVSRNWQKIITKHKLSFNINEIYEKINFISKQSEKLLVLKRKARSLCDLTFYKLDPQINTRIEMEMLDRDTERKQFRSEKDIRERKTHNFAPSFKTSVDIMSEDSVLIMDDEFIC